MDAPILGFFKEYRWLSNFHIVEIVYEGLIYSSTEAAYMASKTEDILVRQHLTQLTPREAKEFSPKIKLRNDWDRLRLGVMFDLLQIKYNQPDLREKLLATKDAYLEETNTWGDRFWGVDKTGLNMLGFLTMAVRKSL